MTEVKPVSHVDVVNAARAWVGVRWKHQGRTRVGVDCIGLPVVICKLLHLSDYDWQGYDREPDTKHFMSHFYKAGAKRIDPKKCKDGDLAVFHQSGFPCHVGILSTKDGRPAVIHASMGHKKVVEEILQPNTTLMAVFEIPNVVD